MIKGFFFDLDGTLVDTYRADYMAYHDAIAEVKELDVSEPDFAQTHGQEMRDKLKSLAPGTTEAEADRIAAAKKRYYQQYLHLTIPNKNLINFLSEFSEHHAIVLVTTAKSQNARSVLRKHDLEKYFSHFVFGDEVKHPKPHPEAYLTALQKTGLSPKEVIAFEDTDSGIRSAEAAGIAVVHVRTFAG